MDTSTLLWTLAATLFAGLQVFVGKVVAHEKRDSAFSGMFTYGISGIISIVVLAVSRQVPVVWMPIMLLGVASGGVHAYGNFLRIESLKFIDSVLYFPINKILGPILVVLAGVFAFGDSLSPVQYIGIGLSLMVPMLLVSQSEHHRQNNLRKGVMLLVVSTAITSLAIVIAKESYSFGAVVMFLLFASQIGGVMVSTALFGYQNKSLHFPSIVSRRDITLGMLAGTLGFLSYFSLLTAMSTGYISLVYVIHAHYILIPIILSVWMHNDHIDARKLTAIVVSSLAIVLLYRA